MDFKVVEPPYLLLNGKRVFKDITYEDFLVEIINFSEFFNMKKPPIEHYILVSEQHNKENDIYSSTYQMDLKLLVDEDVMMARNKNKPDVDYSHFREGFIYSYDTPPKVKVPEVHILKDIMECKIEELRNGKCSNDTIQHLVNNIKKQKNLFFYYPYEFQGVSNEMMVGFETMITKYFNNLFSFRDELGLNMDTYVCFKINDRFVITEWFEKRLVIRDSVKEVFSRNYRDLKLYSVY